MIARSLINERCNRDARESAKKLIAFFRDVDLSRFYFSLVARLDKDATNLRQQFRFVADRVAVAAFTAFQRLPPTTPQGPEKIGFSDRSNPQK